MLRHVAETAHALADPSRLRIVAALAGGELCVCQIVELLGLADSTVSKHLAVLRRGGLADMRREGRWIHYRLAENASPPALDWARRALKDDPLIREDAERLRVIRRKGRAACNRPQQN